MTDILLNNMTDILIFCLLGLVLLTIGAFWFDKVMTRGFDLRHVLYTDDNQAAGYIAASFTISQVMFITAVILGDRAGERIVDDLILSVLYYILAIALFAIIRLAHNVIMKGFFSVDINDEIFKQNNMAAARVEGALYVAIGLILAACIY